MKGGSKISCCSLFVVEKQCEVYVSYLWDIKHNWNIYNCETKRVSKVIESYYKAQSKKLFILK